jgi:hypothetical protein
MVQAVWSDYTLFADGTTDYYPFQPNTSELSGGGGISIATVHLSATDACCAGINIFKKDKSKVALKI